MRNNERTVRRTKWTDGVTGSGLRCKTRTPARLGSSSCYIQLCARVWVCAYVNEDSCDESGVRAHPPLTLSLSLRPLFTWPLVPTPRSAPALSSLSIISELQQSTGGNLWKVIYYSHSLLGAHTHTHTHGVIYCCAGRQ